MPASNTQAHKKSLQPCPCGSDQLYCACCQPFHLGDALASSAQILMQTRYSAYALQLNDYIQNSWHPSTRANSVATDEITVKWVGLLIKKTWTGDTDNEAFVEFEARYKVNGKAEKMAEISRFVFENGQWFYIDGVVS